MFHCLVNKLSLSLFKQPVNCEQEQARIAQHCTSSDGYKDALSRANIHTLAHLLKQVCTLTNRCAERIITFNVRSSAIS